MKTYTYSLLLAAAATGMAFGQTAYTTPVGYVALGDTTVGQPAVKANTDVAISLPLNRPTEYAGAVSATTSTTITLAGTPAFTANQWAPGAATPYLVTIKSGTENGFIGLITSNTVDTLTVTAVTAGSLVAPNVAAGDTVQISKAWTLSAFLPVGSVPNGTRLLVYNGTSSGVNLAPNTTYSYNSTTTNWTVGPTISNNVILYPGESYVLRSPAALSIATLVVSGEVPIGNSRTFIDKITAGVGQDTRLSYFGAGEEIIGDSGLGASLGLVSGDRLLAFNNSAAGLNKSPNETLTYTAGTNTWAIGPNNVTSTYTLKAGRGYVIRRAAAAPVGSLDWKDTQTYVPSL